MQRQLEEPKRTKPNEPRQTEQKQPETDIDEQPINQTQTQRNTRRLKEQTNQRTRLK